MSFKFWRIEKQTEGPILNWDNLAGKRSTQHVCPVDPNHKFSGQRIGDLHLVVKEAPFQDFVWTWYNDCLIRDHVLDLFKMEGFTGFEARPVHLRWWDNPDRPLPILWEIQVTGWGGIAPPESGIKCVERCTACGRQVYTPFTYPKFLVDQKQWDGTDFFLVWPISRFFITDRVTALIKNHNLTGADLVPLNQMTFPKHVKFLGPLPLRYRLPDEQARRIGEPLGIY